MESQKNILIVAATQLEVESFYQQFKYQLDFLFTGVGMVATTYQLTKKLASKKFDLVINAGIGGGLFTEEKLGTVVEVVTDEFLEVGTENDQKFISIFDLGLADRNKSPFTMGKLSVTKNHLLGLPKWQGITVNKVHGNEASIQQLPIAYELTKAPTIESMEGAAVFYVCLLEGVDFVQIRSMSNYVEKRDKSKWNIPLAVKNLNTELERIITSYV